ncbi:MAG: 7-cyano-7-deazaguanine synthase QueC [Proteobacteria bacterium]|nr:7-cyano-7-deazaguanine synthase QueC [Pseudomonadota bacterium]
MKSVVLLSGGLDSSANLAFARHFDDPVLALTVNYGQKAWPGELKASQGFARHYKIEHRILDFTWLGALGGSALTSGALGIPSLASNQLDDLTATKKTASQVWVPNRNGLFINAAAAIAESMGAQQVVVGFNKEEAATFPDNSAQFLGVATLALRYSTRNGVKVISYTEMMVKTEIVEALGNLGDPFPFELVWSCYEGGEVPCGKCESCRRLERARGKGKS